MSLMRTFKSWIIPQLLLSYIFITTGVAVCCLMVLFSFLWLIDRRIYRKVMFFLAYCHWSQLTFLAQWWAGIEVMMYTDEKDDAFIGHEHMIAILNHKYEIDWLMAALVSELYGILGGTKTFMKKSLMYVPLLGWAWYFTENIFLRRDIERDRKTINEDLASLVEFPEGYWMSLLLYPEGTRFTEEKLKASQDVCIAKGYPLPKHTLLPRTKGFVLAVRALKGKIPALYDCTVGFSGETPTTMMNIVNGLPMLSHFKIKRIPLEEVPTDTDEACGEWLRETFRQKDALYDQFLKTGKFSGNSRILKRRWHDLLTWGLWAVLTCVPLFYYIVNLFSTGSLLQQLIFIAFGVALSVGVRMMIRVSETDKGSSYGNKRAGDQVKPCNGSPDNTEGNSAPVKS